MNVYVHDCVYLIFGNRFTQIIIHSLIHLHTHPTPSLQLVFVPLSEVHSDWQRLHGLEHLQTIGHHFNIYSHVFGFHFRPRGSITVTYPGEHEVHRGNIITAEEASLQPTVTLPPDLTGYSTLVFSNPDGHLYDSSQEVLHWMM